MAYPGGSPDFPLSIGRVEGFTQEMRLQYGVQIVDTPEEVAARCDAILLISADGRVHMDQFKRIAPYGKPVFIDKPLALRTIDAEEIVKISALHRVPVMSASALRYADSLTAELRQNENGPIIGADVHGPMNVETTQSYYFWYGIHMAEMLFAILGTGCVAVSAVSTESHDLIVGKWSDGRIGTIRGVRGNETPFGAVVHRKAGTAWAEIRSSDRTYYASLLEQVVPMFVTGRPALDIKESLEIIRFLEAAEASRNNGVTVPIFS